MLGSVLVQLEWGAFGGLYCLGLVLGSLVFAAGWHWLGHRDADVPTIGNLLVQGRKELQVLYLAPFLQHARRTQNINPEHQVSHTLLSSYPPASSRAFHQR